jgi:hypothetical protein
MQALLCLKTHTKDWLYEVSPSPFISIGNIIASVEVKQFLGREKPHERN